jgi:hypothetical protein
VRGTLQESFKVEFENHYNCRYAEQGFSGSFATKFSRDIGCCWQYDPGRARWAMTLIRMWRKVMSTTVGIDMHNHVYPAGTEPHPQFGPPGGRRGPQGGPAAM